MTRQTFFNAVGSMIIAWAGALAASGESINSLVSEARARNPELEYYRSAIAVARGERRIAGEYPNPDLRAELGGKVIGRGGSGAGPLGTLAFDQPIDFASRRVLRKAIAEHQIALAQLALVNFELELANRVRLLAYQTILAQKKSDAAQEVAGRFGDLTRVLNERQPAGVAPQLEARIIEANALALDRQRVEAERELQTATYELNQLRAAAAGTPIALDAEELRFSALPSTAQLVAIARSGNFDVRMREAELEQQGFRVRLSRAEKWASPSVGAFAHEETADADEYQFGISVRLPLPLWNQNKGAIETARARELQAAASLNATMRKVENEVAAAVAMYNARLKEIAKWSPEVLGRMREAAELADKNYRLGAVPVATYTELQKEYLQAQTALLNTQADALEARQKVELLVGQRAGRRTTTEFSK
jgi:cobalt-zinc-cadmium efflux system outer membrane protein